jgi:hypothetical protein
MMRNNEHYIFIGILILTIVVMYTLCTRNTITENYTSKVSPEQQCISACCSSEGCSGPKGINNMISCQLMCAGAQ